MSSRRALGWLLRLYPRPFRRSFGDEMLDVFALHCDDVRRRDGVRGLARLWGRTVSGVARAALLERVEGRGSGDEKPSYRLPRKERAPMDRIAQDVRFGFRSLLRNPGFSAVAVLTLALGIGINTAVFSLVNAFLLRPLPHVEAPDRLAVLFTGEGGSSVGVTSYMDYLDFEERTTAFAGFAAYKPLLMDFSGAGETERVQGMIVSGNYFDVLGVQPAHGRFFTAADDDEPDGETAAVLGHALWQERFGGDPGVVGQTVLLNGRTFDVIGVAPADFRGTFLESRPQVFATMMMQPHFMPASGNVLGRRGWGGILTVGRLADGVSMEQASDDIAGVATWLYEAFPMTADWGREYVLIPLERATLTPEQRGMIVQFSTLLMGVMVLVLLVACVNVANLMLARSLQRGPEIAVRQALGADRAGLFRQLLVESMTLAAAGGVAGLLLAYWSQSLLRALPFPLELDLGFDARVVGFAALASVITGVVFGLMPAVRATKVDVAARMRPSGGAARSSRRGFANSLVVAQVALSLILLVGAGLFARTLVSLGTVDLGFDADNVLVATVDPGLQGYEGGAVKSFYDRLVPSVEAVPGVERVSMVNSLPGPDNDDVWSIVIQGYTPPDDERLRAYVGYVATGYFRTMGIPIVRGRDFTAPEAARAMTVVVNETAAAFYNERTGRDALGGRIGFEGPDGDFAEIIGIAADSTVGSLRAAPRPQVYLPHDQIAALGMGARMTLLVRTGSLDPLGVLAGVRAAVAETDPNVPLFDAGTLESHLSSTLVQERLSAVLLGFSAALSLLLASVGLYGVLSYAVTQRTKEMGIRMALGAHTAQVRRLVVRQGMVVVAGGVAIGLAGAYAASSMLSGFLYGVVGTDPVTYVAVIGLLGLVSLIAAYVPARRATRVDPLSALRTD